MTVHAPARVGNILLIDDEQRVVDFVARALRAEGFEVDAETSGEDGFRRAATDDYDLVILDLLIPGSDGRVLLSRIKRLRPELSVIVLSCLDDTRTKVACLEAGADDYIAKPFALDELLARVHVRVRDRHNAPVTRLRAGGITLDLLDQEVESAGRRIKLTRRETLVLAELMRAAGEVVSKERLLSAVWGYSFEPASNVVDVYIRRLRGKLPPGTIATVRAQGYRVHAG